MKKKIVRHKYYKTLAYIYIHALLAYSKSFFLGVINRVNTNSYVRCDSSIS